MIRALRPSFERSPASVLLTTRGRRTRLPREVLLPCARTADTIVVISTYGWRSDWIRNIRHDPAVLVTHEGRTVPARAEIVEDVARKRAIVSEHPFFPATLFAFVNRALLALPRPVLVAWLCRWVTPRPVVVLRMIDTRVPIDA